MEDGDLRAEVREACAARARRLEGACVRPRPGTGDRRRAAAALGHALNLAKRAANLSPGKVFLDLYAGTAPLGRWFASKGYGALAIDIMDGPQCDLGSAAVLRTVGGWIRSGQVLGACVATPCTTLTRARRENQVGMPRPLRTREELWGRRDATEQEKLELKKANGLIQASTWILHLCAKVGVPVIEENPHTSLLWQFRSRQRLLLRCHSIYADFCASGGPARKRTRFLMINCGSPGADHLHCKGRNGMCSFTGQKHLHLTGKSGAQWLTKKYEPYPQILVDFLGQVMCGVLHRSAVAYLSGLIQWCAMLVLG